MTQPVDQGQLAQIPPVKPEAPQGDQEAPDAQRGQPDQQPMPPPAPESVGQGPQEPDIVGLFARIAAVALGVWCVLYWTSFLFALVGDGGWVWASSVALASRVAEIGSLVTMVVASVFALVLAAVDTQVQPPRAAE